MVWEVLRPSLLVSTVRTNTQEQTWAGVTGPARQGTRPALELCGCALQFHVCLPSGGLQSHAWLLLPIPAAPDSLRLPPADAFASFTGLHGAAPLLPNTPFPFSGRTSKRRERQRWRSVHRAEQLGVQGEELLPYPCLSDLRLGTLPRRPALQNGLGAAESTCAVKGCFSAIHSCL